MTWHFRFVDNFLWTWIIGTCHLCPPQRELVSPPPKPPEYFILSVTTSISIALALISFHECTSRLGLSTPCGKEPFVQPRSLHGVFPNQVLINGDWMNVTKTNMKNRFTIHWSYETMGKPSAEILHTMLHAYTFSILFFLLISLFHLFIYVYKKEVISRMLTIQ